MNRAWRPVATPRRSSTVAIAVTLAVRLWLPSPARSAGLTYPDNGTVSIGRAGAYAADPGDGHAMIYNPAGLAKQAGLRLMLDGRAVRVGVTYESQEGERSENGAGPIYHPALALTYGFGPTGVFSGLSVGIGVFGPSAIGDLSFPKEGSQRYQLVASHMLVAQYSTSIAASLGDIVSFGVTLQLMRGDIEYALMVRGLEGFETHYDIHATAEASVGFNPAAILGLTVRPLPTLAVGLSFAQGVDLVGDATVTLQATDFVNAWASFRQEGDAATLRVPLADVWRIGVSYEIAEDWTIEADCVLERWSQLQSIDLDIESVRIVTVPGNTPRETVLRDVAIEKQYTDSSSIRIGLEHHLLALRLTLRAGYLYESSAVPEAYVHVDTPNWDRQVLGVGGTVYVGPVAISLAYAHHIVATQKTANSAIRQVTSERDVTSGEILEGAVVGNGTYSSSLDIISVSVSIAYDHEARALCRK